MKTRKVGTRDTGKGAGWGTALGVPVGVLSGGVTLIGGALVGAAASVSIPIPDPGFVRRQVADFTESVGWSDSAFLGLSAEDWVSLALAMLLFLLAYWAAL